MFNATVLNLVNDVDVENTRHQIDMYKRENADQIKKNRIKRVSYLM